MPNGNGVVIYEVVAVDDWSAKARSSAAFFFLSHLHADHTACLNSSWSGRVIFTSHLNAKLAPLLCGVDPAWLRPLDLNVEHNIADDFSVTLIDANHIAGAVMFLFRGCLGNILVTGDFRLSSDMLSHPAIAAVRSDVDELYLDNTFLAKECDFSSRETVLKRLILFLNTKPNHKIYLGARKLGKEEAFVEIAKALNERICVDTRRMELYRKLDLADVFTTNGAEARIFIVSQQRLKRSFLERENRTRPTLGVILSALFYNWPSSPYTNSQSYGLHVFEYSDHCSYGEILRFVSHVRPKRILPIVKKESRSGFLCDRGDFLRSRADLAPLERYLSRDAIRQPDVNALLHSRVQPVSKTAAPFRGGRATLPRRKISVYRGPKGVTYASSTSASSKSSTSATPMLDIFSELLELRVKEKIIENLPEALELIESALDRIETLFQ
jgi:DNA cross-link repair 1B protein